MTLAAVMTVLEGYPLEGTAVLAGAGEEGVHISTSV